MLDLGMIRVPGRDERTGWGATGGADTGNLNWGDSADAFFFTGGAGLSDSWASPEFVKPKRSASAATAINLIEHFIYLDLLDPLDSCFSPNKWPTNSGNMRF